MADLSRHRPNVGVVLFNARGQVWLGRRVETPGPYNWQFPQGGMDDGETPREAALRELAEETGARSVEYLGETDDWLAYDFPPDHPKAKNGAHWRGQKQLWFAFRFAGPESEFDLTGHDQVEFDAWRWADLTDALATVIPFKREVYRAVVAAFAPWADRPATMAPV